MILIRLRINLYELKISTYTASDIARTFGKEAGNFPPRGPILGVGNIFIYKEDTTTSEEQENLQVLI